MKTPAPARLLAALALAATAALADPGPIVLRPFASGFAAPVEIAFAPNDTRRMFVVEQGGRIRLVRDGALVPTPFLDITPLVQSGGEQGLLGLAFHPRYPADPRFFVYHNRAASPPTAGSEIVIASYRVSSGNPDVADPASRVERLAIAHPLAQNHNGGKLAFGPDGKLYAGVGDGGSGGDPQNNAQNLGSLLGKLLRLDIDQPVTSQVPADNPFVGNNAARGEIYAYGLRNPWRFSFDRETGDLFIADVGQNAWEEVDFVPAGGVAGRNFGWRVFEATHCFNPATNCSLAGHTLPVLEYGHNAQGGFSITGGYRYRGHMFRELRGHYVYADFVSGRLWAALPDAGGTWTAVVAGAVTNASTFGEDPAGELYVADINAGTVRRLGPPDADGDGMSDAFEAATFGGNGGVAAADTDNDGLSNLVEYREGRDPNVKDNDLFGDPRLFAMQQYRDFLGREGDEPGIQFWQRSVAPPPGGFTRAEAIRQFLESPEFKGTGAPLARLYFAYFTRIPDYDGLTFWMASFRAGNPLATISDAFAGSAEFRATYGALDNGQFVDRVYRNVLGRAPDAPGLAFWRGQLDSGAQTRGQVMLAFSDGPEFRALIENEVAVTMTYAGMLRRAPDAAGFSFWVGSLDQGTSVAALMDGFYNAPEYRQRFLP